MSEAGFSLRVHPHTLDDGLRLIAGFREIADTSNIDEEGIKQILTKSAGPGFVSILTRKLVSEADFQALSDFFTRHEGVDSLMRLSRIHGKNPDVGWIESRSGQLEAWELCPDYITLHTRSEDYGEFHSRIDLDYGFTEIGPIKSAVFACAFVEAGFKVADFASWDDNEHAD